MGVILSAGGSLRWTRDILSNVRSDTGDYGAFIEPAKYVAPGADGLFFLPYLAGERTPHMDPAARGAWIGLSLAHGRDHLVRAVLEGVAFALRDAWERMKMLDAAPSVLRVVGGGAKSALWMRILSSVLNVPLQRIEVDEGAAFGAALLAGVGAGMYADLHEAVNRTVKARAESERPEPSLVDEYEALYPGYVGLYPALKGSGLWGVNASPAS
jgi:xylulokinase